MEKIRSIIIPYEVITRALPQLRVIKIADNEKDDPATIVDAYTITEVQVTNIIKNIVEEDRTRERVDHIINELISLNSQLSDNANNFNESDLFLTLRATFREREHC